MIPTPQSSNQSGAAMSAPVAKRSVARKDCGVWTEQPTSHDCPTVRAIYSDTNFSVIHEQLKSLPVYPNRAPTSKSSNTLCIYYMTRRHAAQWQALGGLVLDGCTYTNARWGSRAEGGAGAAAGYEKDTSTSGETPAA